MTDYPHNEETPFTIVGLDHVVLYVDGMDKALAFYQGVLGLPHAYSYPNIAMEQLWIGTELLVLIDLADPKGAKARPDHVAGKNMDHFCISVGPFDKDSLKAHLEKHNVEIVNEAFHGGARGMGEAIYINDPFGNMVELKGPPVI